MLPFASCLTCRTHFDITILASTCGGTNTHVSLLISELFSAPKASFHFPEFSPSKASYIDCGTHVSPQQSVIWPHSDESHHNMIIAILTFLTIPRHANYNSHNLRILITLYLWIMILIIIITFIFTQWHLRLNSLWRRSQIKLNHNRTNSNVGFRWEGKPGEHR